MHPEKNKTRQSIDTDRMFTVNSEITFNYMLSAINISINSHLNSRAQYHTNCVKKKLTKIRNRPNFREKVGKFSKEHPFITSTGIAVASGVTGVAAASSASGAISSSLAISANSATQGLVSNAFGDVATGAGMFSGLVQPMVNGISRFTGDALGTVITIAVPPLIFSGLTYVFYRALKLSFKLAIHAIGKSAPHKDLSFLPHEHDPMFDFLCSMPTLIALKELELELKMGGFTEIKFNFNQYRAKLIKGLVLTKEETAINDLAKKSAKRLFTIAKKIGTTKKPEKYQNLQETKTILREVHATFYFQTPEKSNYQSRYCQLIKCLTVVGVLVNMKKDFLQRKNFFQIFSAILSDASISLKQAQETITPQPENSSTKTLTSLEKHSFFSGNSIPKSNNQKLGQFRAEAFKG